MDLASADDFITTLGEALHARSVAGARSRICYSSISGILSGHFFTRDAAVLALALHGHVPSPAKLRGLWLHQLANGLSSASPMTLQQYAAQSEELTTGLDPANLPAAYMLDAADMFALEPPSAAGLGGAASSWLRSATLAHVAEDVPGHPGLVRLRWLGDLHFYAPGIFLSA